MDAAPATAAPIDHLKGALQKALLAPIRAFRPVYLPLLMVYFAYGALGLIAVADSFWVKKALTFSPAALAQLSVWLTLPWAMKMVFGELVDTVALFGSQRRLYVFAGASLIATGLIILAGAAGNWIAFAAPEVLYVIAQLVIVVGVVLQDVVADAMSTEVVPRTHADGSPREKAEIDRDLGMVQVLGRLALSIGIFAVAGLGGWLAQVVSYETVFLLGLAIPAISASGAFLVKLETSEGRPTDWRILGGGLAFGFTITLLALSGLPFNQEIVFVISMTVVVLMLDRVTQGVGAETRRKIAFAALIIFAFRATPVIGEGYRWFTIDVLGFDEAFYGTLAQIGAGIALVATWLLSEAITKRPVATVLLWLTILGGFLSLPTVMLVFRLDLWTEAMLGFGARTIAIVDTAVASPLAQLSMVPLLTLIAIYSPPAHRATWFALMASFMNLALVAAQLGTKYLNWLFVVERGSYGQLPTLAVTVIIIGVAVPLLAIFALRRRIR
jgi:MFS family permease